MASCARCCNGERPRLSFTARRIHSTGLPSIGCDQLVAIATRVQHYGRKGGGTAGVNGLRGGGKNTGRVEVTATVSSVTTTGDVAVGTGVRVKGSRTVGEVISGAATAVGA